MIITIDGPVASGKTSVARAVSQKLGYTYLASGMLYRAVAYILVDRYRYDHVQLNEPCSQDINEIVDRLRYENELDGPHVHYGNEDVTLYLKTPTVDKSASLLATTCYIHEVLAVFQRTIAAGKNVVIESRDAGTVVFPEAECKVFLTASSEERARRWQNDQAQRGTVVSLEQACMLIGERDTRDMTRAVRPLLVPLDAHVVDSTRLSFDEVVRIITSFC